MGMENMFRHLEEDAILDLRLFQITPTIYNQFLYDVGDQIILRDEIKIGTISGGVEFEEVHENAKYEVLTIKDSIIDEYGSYYITDKLGDEVKVTDSMVDQIKTKDHHIWSEQDPLRLIIGRTASGKDTFAKRLKDEGLLMVKSYTTRPRRLGEGYTHKFIDSVDGFDPQWAKSDIDGYKYFALPEDVYNNDVMIIDPNGLHDLLGEDEFNRSIKIYYLMVSPSTRMGRYTSRSGDSEDEFFIRNDAENKQFEEFERLLQDEDFREKYNITVISSETREGEPYYREMVWIPLPQDDTVARILYMDEDFPKGMWATKSKERI